MSNNIGVEILKKQVWAACTSKIGSSLPACVSAADRKLGIAVIKPEDVEATIDNMAVVSLSDGKQLGGRGIPAPELPVHLAVYRAYPQVGAIVHITTKWASAFSRAGRSIPVYSETHARAFGSEIVCTDVLSDEAYEGDMMTAIGDAVAEAMRRHPVGPSGAVMIRYSGALVWDKTPCGAIEGAEAFESVAQIADTTEQQNPNGLTCMPQAYADRLYRESIRQKTVLDGVESHGTPGQTVTIADQRKINMELLVYFDEVCRKNGIHYSLTGGTLLGAIRHRGFIPWDDDVDVFMTRPEYEKVEKAFDSGNRFIFVSKKSEPNFNYVFGRVVDTKTLITESPNTLSAGKGLFLDVCVVDGLPKNALARKLHIAYMRFLMRGRRATIHDPAGKGYQRRGRLVVFAKKIIRSLTDYQFWNRRLEKAMARYPFDHSEYVGNFTSQYGGREMMHRSAFDSYEDVEFEGHQCMICAGYDEYLTNIYHKYMSLPPKAKRKGHHTGTIRWV